MLSPRLSVPAVGALKVVLWPPAVSTSCRFGVVGVGCALLYAVLAWSLTALGGLAPTAGSIVAYAAAGVASYLGQSDVFDRAIADFSEAYADQNERDYAAMMGAIESGRVVAETGI